MAIQSFKIPICDACGEPWFPSAGLVWRGIRARDDPRAYDAARKADGQKGLRCGKCKTPHWDTKFLGDGRKIPRSRPNGAAAAEPEPEVRTATLPTEAPARPKRCAHGFFRCSICNPPEAGL